MSEGRGAENLRDVGSVIAKRYALRVHLGTGRYGEVYEAVDKSHSGSVALHLLHDRIAQRTRFLQKLESSYQQPHTWSHANIVKVRGFGCDAGRYFLVLEWLEGATLRSLLDESPSEPPSETEAFAIIRGIGDALKYAHAKGAIHGDIRPQKIFLTTDRVVKVLDLLPATSPRSGLFFVEDTSPSSLAPPDECDDVYGLACIAYELLTGKHPFDGRSPRVASSAGMTPAPIAGLGAQRWAALARGLALRRDQRTPNIAVFLVELGVASQEAQRSTKTSTPQHAASAPPRSATAPPARPPRPEPPPLEAARAAVDDDMPIIGDYSGTFSKVVAAEPEPAPERQPSPPSPPSAPSDNTWRIDPRDVRRHAQRKKRGRAPGDMAFRLGALLIGGLVALAIFSNYDMLRDRAEQWMAAARDGSADLPSAAAERRPASDTETIEVTAPAVVPTPDLPPEDAAETAVRAGSPADRTRTDPAPGAPAPGAPAPAAPAPAAPAPGDAAQRAVAPAETSPPVEPAQAEAGVEAVRNPEAAARGDAAPRQPPAAEVAEPVVPVEPESFAFAANVVTVSEGQPGASITVRRRGGTRGESSIVWWASDGSASAGEDYANLGTSNEKFAPGEQTRTILVPIVGDARAEARESFFVNLGDVSQAISREPSQRIEVVIDDDD